jgi:LmbE family N-acetylglucosaminyl deacetylase
MTSYNSADIPALLSPTGGEVNPAIFVFAHQDDETLTFGAEVIVHKAAGRYVTGYCVTDGRSSSARQLTGLSVTDFVKARNLELMSAASDLGFDELHWLGMQDGSLSNWQTADIADMLYRRWPTASFKVPWEGDSNADHAAIGHAFRAVKNVNPTADIRFYIKPEDRSRVASYRTSSLEGSPYADQLAVACAEYQRVDHDNGRYGIGYLSVPFDFDNFQPISTFVL